MEKNKAPPRAENDTPANKRTCRRVNSISYFLYGEKEENMSLITKNNGIKLETYLPEPVFYLNQVTPRYVYQDGKRTDQLVGYVYLATNTECFEQVKVMVEGPPLLEPEELLKRQAAGEKVFVEFIDAIVKHYFSDRTKQIEDSIKANSVQMVENDTL